VVVDAVRALQTQSAIESDQLDSYRQEV
jgi:hypothetical protein